MPLSRKLAAVGLYVAAQAFMAAVAIVILPLVLVDVVRGRK